MAGKTNVLVIGISALLILSLGFGGYEWNLYQKEKIKAEDLQTQVDDLTVRNRKAQLEIEEKSSKISILETNNQDLNTELLGVKGAFRKEQEAKTEALNQVQKLTTQLNDQNNTKSTLEKKLSESEKTLRDVDKRVKEMEEQLKDAESRKKELEQKVKLLEEKVQNVELGKIVISQDGKQQAPLGQKKSEVSIPVALGKALEGKVMVVNKDYKFVVISLGKQDGVVSGSLFSVMHNNKNIGTVKIEKVHDTMSAAGFATADLKDKITEGDSVVSQNSK